MHSLVPIVTIITATRVTLGVVAVSIAIAGMRA